MEDKGKTILFLGSGFDLAHGLPTKYSHFWIYVKELRISSYGDLRRV